MQQSEYKTFVISPLSGNKSSNSSCQFEISFQFMKLTGKILVVVSRIEVPSLPLLPDLGSLCLEARNSVTRLHQFGALGSSESGARSGHAGR